MPAPSPGQLWTTVRKARLIRVLAVYLGASFVVLEAIDILTEQLGLPDWVFPGAIILLLIGLPIIVATALVQGAPARPTGAQALDLGAPLPEFSGEVSASDVAAVAKHWLTWKKVILGGVLAFAFLGVVVTGYTAMRVLGIGPVGSLVAAGALDRGERILLADFENLTADSLLSPVLTEAFRIDIAQSPLITIAEPAYVAGVLRRMQRDPGTRLDAELAREIALREGLKAVIVGEVGALGERYIVSVTLLSAESGAQLTSFQETADGAEELIGAIERLSRRLRERIGESLKSIRASEPLEAVTTGSLEALHKYSMAVRAVELEGAGDKAIALLAEAVALDPKFAMAWRKLGVVLSNMGVQRARMVEALTKAFEHRDRLPDVERYLTEAMYFGSVTGERDKEFIAYESLLDIDPNQTTALNNQAVNYWLNGDYVQAEAYARRALELDSTASNHIFNIIAPQMNSGQFDSAAAYIELMKSKFPGNPWANFAAANLAYNLGEYDAAEAELAQLRAEQAQSPSWRVAADYFSYNLSATRGHLAAAERHLRDAMTTNERRGLGAEYLSATASLGRFETWQRGGPAAGSRLVDEALRRIPLDSIDPIDWPYVELAEFYAEAGRADEGRALLAEYESRVAPELRRAEGARLRMAWGSVYLAEGAHDDAIREFRLAYEARPFCLFCPLARLGRAYDSAGEADSAIAVYERYVTPPLFARMIADADYRGFAFERLGALYEERGDADKAVYYYGKLVELWGSADPELQPRVEAARRAIAVLSSDR